VVEIVHMRNEGQSSHVGPPPPWFSPIMEKKPLADLNVFRFSNFTRNSLPHEFKI
jgi:hypothetical protein